jgi:hypothetical protein
MIKKYSGFETWMIPWKSIMTAAADSGSGNDSTIPIDLSTAAETPH